MIPYAAHNPLAAFTPRGLEIIVGSQQDELLQLKSIQPPRLTSLHFRVRRRHLGLSRVQLAHRIGCTVADIDWIEKPKSALGQLKLGSNGYARRGWSIMAGMMAAQ